MSDWGRCGVERTLRRRALYGRYPSRRRHHHRRHLGAVSFLPLTYARQEGNVYVCKEVKWGKPRWILCITHWIASYTLWEPDRRNGEMFVHFVGRRRRLWRREQLTIVLAKFMGSRGDAVNFHGSKVKINSHVTNNKVSSNQFYFRVAVHFFLTKLKIISSWKLVSKQKSILEML